jgi:Bacterial extracellular solute-binding protein
MEEKALLSSLGVFQADRLYLQSESTPRHLRRFQLRFGDRIFRIVKNGQPSKARHNLCEQLQPLRARLRVDESHTGYVAAGVCEALDNARGDELAAIEADDRNLGVRMLIARKDKAQPVEIRPGFDLAKLIGRGYLALAEVDSVPAGRYAKAALEKLNVWSSVADKVAQSSDVRGALLRVSRGQTPLGIVYQTDAATDQNVKIIGMFPENTHPSIIYPIALTTKASNPDAAAFHAYLRGSKAKAEFEALGFTVLNQCMAD